VAAGWGGLLMAPAVCGMRTPGTLLIVSPYACPGFTNTTPTTFADILAYTEQIWQFSWSR